MKTKSGREFGNDISDIIGVIKAEKSRGNNITYSEIIEAGTKLYGQDFEKEISESLKARIQQYTNSSENELAALYEESIKKAENIKNDIEIIIEEQDMKINRASVKDLGILVEQMQQNKETDEYDYERE